MNANFDTIEPYARRGIGLILAAGGAFTLSDAWRTIQPNDLAAKLAMLTSILQCLGGLWLLREPTDRTLPWLIALFLGLWGAGLAQIALGRCSSGRFGSVAVSPWFTLIFDVAALIVLLKGGMSADDDASAMSPRRLAGPAALAILIAVAGVLPVPPVVIHGRATFKGEPFEDGELIFQGNFISVIAETDQAGAFRLPPIRPGAYRVMLGDRPFLPPSTPDPAQSKSADGTPAKRARMVSITRRPPRNAKQGEVEPVRPRGDSGILSWEAPPCCGEAIPFPFVAGDSRRAIGW